MIDGFNHFREIWLLDFEFRAPPGHCPRVLCMVARELRTNRLLRMWEFELRGLSKAPFSVGDDTLIVCYFAPAEMGCFVDLGWPPPRHILDLYVEYKALMNGRKLSPNRYGLPSALMSLGIPTVGAEYCGPRQRALPVSGRPCGRTLCAGVQWNLAQSYGSRLAQGGDGHRA